MKMEYNKRVLLVVGVAIFLFAIVVFAIPFGYTAIEVRNVDTPTTAAVMVDTPSTSYECSDVKIKGNVVYTTAGQKCVNSDQVCSGQEQYCCSYGTECASYEQYCVQYGTKNGACKTWNWLHTVCAEYYQVQGDCIDWGSKCASTKQVCDKQCSRCANYNTVCKKYNHYADYSIHNADDTGGTFVVTVNFLDSNKNTVGTDVETVWVDAGATVSKEFNYYDTSEVSIGYSKGYVSTYPTKQQCGNVIVTKQVLTDKVVMTPQDKEFPVQKKATLYERWSGKVQYYYHQ
jgi:hypothetical protein